ncbi:MAG: NYN domain-containing protein [Lysobacterales bacterium]
MDRCAIFIDGGYVDKLFQIHLGGVRVDYGKFANHMSVGSNLLRTYYYHCLPYQHNPPTSEERDRFSAKEKFICALSRLPRFQVRLGKLEHRGIRADGTPIFTQKRVDIMLGVDMVELAATHQINRAVLVAGDSDFLPAIEVVKRHGVLTSLWHGTRGGPGRQSTCHNDLWDMCDERFEIDATVAQAVAR